MREASLPDNVHSRGRTAALVCITLLVLFTISAPEDYKVSYWGTASILPPKIIKLGKLASRAVSFGLLGFYLAQLISAKRLYRALGAMLPWLFFCGWIVASTMWSPLKSITLVQSISFCLLITLSLAIGLSWRGEQDASRILRQVSLLLVLLAVGLIILHFAAPRYGALTKRSSGIFHSTVAGSSSSLAVMILLLSGLLWQWNWSLKLLVPGILVHGTVMIICGNRLSLALTIVLAMFSIVWFMSSQKVAAILLPCGMLGTVFLAADPRLELPRNGIAGLGTFLSQGQTSDQLREASGRAEMWRTVWNSYWDSPLFGHGHFVTSSRGELYVWYEWGNWTAHNFFLQLLTTTGIVGATLLIAGCLVLGYFVSVNRWQDNRMPRFLMILSVWFLGWGVLNASFLGPMQPESVIFAIVVGFALALSLKEANSLHGPEQTLATA